MLFWVVSIYEGNLPIAIDHIYKYHSPLLKWHAVITLWYCGDLCESGGVCLYESTGILDTTALAYP